MANLGYPARALEGPVTDLDGGVVEGPTSPARRKLLLANSAITPCNRLEWSLAAGAPNQADEEANLDASLPTRFPSQARMGWDEGALHAPFTRVYRRPCRVCHVGLARSGRRANLACRGFMPPLDPTPNLPLQRGGLASPPSARTPSTTPTHPAPRPLSHSHRMPAPPPHSHRSCTP